MTRSDTPSRIPGTHDLAGKVVRRHAARGAAWRHAAGLYGFRRVELAGPEPLASVSRSPGEALDGFVVGRHGFADRSSDSSAKTLLGMASIAQAYLGSSRRRDQARDRMAAGQTGAADAAPRRRHA